ncbi:coxsackievirus and adenovirus receptor homolog [Syngnathoides biaculeatus]|uniref:coxsackievirus and adenovirus receptor homolog n=1 Tax=Syngnathoides biaculeatus TaxID=300417 RepID=UPI002ADDFD6F|nr:coxsackievirus and adenovirus receptor homolog [Syngnathoides biaculeatus]XP_061696329.1 coxsackievirus and adenovirus receptor homolog [Syngnathoides biaculeatus]
MFEKDKQCAPAKTMTGCFLWLCALLGVLCCTIPASALIIIMTKTHYHANRGSNVRLFCRYTTALKFTDPIEITWSIVPANGHKQPILRYTNGQVNADLYKPLEGRVQFTSHDPEDGDASIVITDVRQSDSAVYHCFVKMFPGQDKLEMDLTVMDAPSRPQCAADKHFADGHGMTLKCQSSHGTQPLKYTWSKISGNYFLPANAVLDAAEGTLRVENISKKDCGIYRCTVTSMVDSQHCELVLKCPLSRESFVNSPQTQTSTNPVALIAGVVSAVVLVSVAIGVAVYYYRKTKPVESGEVYV